MIRQEMKRLFSSWMFRAVLTVSLLIPFFNTYETWQVTVNDLKMTNQIAAEQTEWVFLSVFAKWIGIETYTSGYSLFFFVFPLLVCIGYGWSFRQELETGYINQIISRVGKKRYYTSKYVSTFLSGGMILALPLLLNLIVGMTFCNLALPDETSLYFNMGNRNFLGPLFFTHPLWFCFLYMLTDFAFGGSLVCLCMTFSYFIKGRVLALPIPFLLLLVWDHISSSYLIQKDTVYTASILRMAHPGPIGYYNSGVIFLSVIAVIFVITALITVNKAGKSDVL